TEDALSEVPSPFQCCFEAGALVQMLGAELLLVFWITIFQEGVKNEKLPASRLEHIGMEGHAETVNLQFGHAQILAQPHSRGREANLGIVGGGKVTGDAA